MSDIGLSHEMNIEQTLEMMLSPRMLQMLKMLNLSYIDLIEEIEQQSEENVMLEVEKPDRLLEYLKHIEGERIPKKEIIHEDLPGIETLAEPGISLQTHLLNQLDLEELKGKKRKIAELLISELDDKGYLQKYEDVSRKIIKDLGVKQSEIDDILDIIQGFEPDGVGARNLKECLLIQLREQSFDSPQLEDVIEKVIEDHLEDLANKDFDKIAKVLKLKKEGVAQISEFIKNNLNPTPGNMYAEKVACVIPSFSVKKDKGKYVPVNLEKTYGPVLKISSTYEKMLKDPKTDAESMEFLKKKLQSARDFIENIQKRHQTIEKILEIIISKQSHVFEGQLEGANSLMQKDIADELGLHPSTISRAIANKFIQTQKGVLLLKDLCPRDVKGLTREKIKTLITEIVGGEDKKTPLSDDEIARRLQEKGINLERRTIAAYRKKLGVEISSKRVKF